MTLRRWLMAWSVVSVALAGCGSPAARPRGGDGERLPRVETVGLTRTMLPVQIELAATVEPLLKADLCARVPGVVAYLPAEIDIGRRVAAGEKLVELAVPDLEAQKKHKAALVEQAKGQKLLAQEALAVAAAELKEAEKNERRFAAEHAYRKHEHQRVHELVRRGAQQPERAQEVDRSLETALAAWEAAKAQIETRQAKLKSCQADLQVAQAKIDVALAEVENLATMVGLATVRAPFDGSITKRWVDLGATIKDPSAPLLTVMHTDTVRVLLDVAERDVPLLNALTQRTKMGDPVDVVTLRVPALREVVPGGEFRGRITRTAGVLDPNTRTMRTEVHLDNRGGHLRPGMYGIATVLLDERYDVATLPSSALVRRGTKTEVYYVDDLTGDPPRGVVKRAEVELGVDDGRRVEIRGGLDGSERVIAKGNGVVRQGETVIAVPQR